MEFEDSLEQDEIRQLVMAYEEAGRDKTRLFLDSDAFEQIIVFYLEHRELTKAEAAIEDALHQFPYEAFFYVKKAELMAETGQTEEAFDLLDFAERIDASDPNIWLVRADLYLWQGDYARSEAVIQQGLALDMEPEERCELLLELADVYENQQKITEMVEVLKKALRVMPKSEEALGRLWFHYEVSEQFQDSIDFHNELVDLSPYNTLAWFNLGHAYASLDRFDEALDALGYCVAIDEQFEPAHTCMGDVYFLRLQYDEALQCYLLSLQIQDAFKELYFKVGECYERKLDYKKAKQHFRKAISIDPQYDEAFFHIGEIQVAQHEYAQAARSFEKAHKLNPDDPEYINALADVYMFHLDDERAIGLYEQAVRLDSGQKQSYVNLATAYFNFNCPEQAFIVLDQAEEQFEDYADLLYIRFVFTYRTGSRKDSLLILQQALSADYALHHLVFDMDEKIAQDPEVMRIIGQFL